MKKNFLALLSVLIAASFTQTASASKIQQQGIKTLADCIAGGATGATCLPLDSQIWDSTNAQQLSASIANGQLGGSGGGSGVELLKNPGFESGTITNGWSTSGGTAALVTSGAHLLYGKATASWQASAASQTFSSGALPILGLAGGGCSASLFYTYAGTTGDYTFQVIDGSSNILNSLSLPTNSNSSVPVTITFPCGASGTSTVNWQLLSNVASPGLVYFDNTHLGSLSTIQPAGLIGTPWTAYTPTISGMGTITGVNFKYRTVGSVEEIEGTWVSGVMTDTDYRISVPFAVASNFVAGTPSGPNLVSSATFGGQYVYPSGSPGDAFFNLWVHSNSTGVSEVITQGPLPAAGSTYYVKAFFPTSQQVNYSGTAISPDTSAASWSGYQSISGGSWDTTSGTFADPTGSGTISLTQLTNRNFGTVVAASGSKSGITWTPPKAGNFQVCASPAFLSANTSTVASARLVDGSGNIINRGATSSLDNASATGSIPSLCGIYTVASVAAVTTKVQTATSAGTLSLTNGGAGSGAINWTITQLDAGQPAPLLTQNVTSSTLGSERVEHARITSTTCAVASQSGSWIGSTTHAGTGQCTLTISVNEWSGNPDCTCSAGNTNFTCVPDLSTLTSSNVSIVTRNGGSVIDTDVSIICMGPR